jgi:hypothetical protein
MDWRTRGVTFLLIFSTLGAMSQDENLTPKWKENWKQKKTNVEYLTKFVLANGTKLYVMGQGKKISDMKLGSIQEEKEGNYEGDFKYIEELKEVPSIIGQSSSLKNIIANQKSILGYLDKTEELLRENSELVPVKNLEMYHKIMRSLKDKLGVDLDELEMVILKNDLKFKDNERLERLSKMEGEYQDKNDFAYLIYKKAINEVQYIKMETRSINESEKYNGTD